ncbi:MAG TPA: pseudouridine-5'-phosphate glycosidase [Bacillota bacterium]|nr:pseudouridine-5'-phosphate glycosidase [Bacillota bacterium]HOR86930.1 pseudouridine-5'-phosphate glycosidase [Bacillota bacterium]HPL53009.1 pseudouridine-5'-phosphate glycosidase [Bacillota bacterium]
MNNYTDYLDISKEVLDGLRYYKPIVALESTIISHGMPYPENIETALSLEKIIRKNNAIPATMGIVKGRIKIGFNQEEIEYLASAKDVIKTSRRDIPYVVSMGLSGGTTVAATMILSQYAGIRVFATGGIGGVHRGADKSFDISADLTELSITNVAVVCAGVKAILDIGLTLEQLETLGVPVIGYGTDDFPAFYTRKSGFKVPMRIDRPQDCAKIMKSKWDLNLDGGIMVANPIPQQYEARKDIIDKAIESALLEAEKDGVKGKETTPYLLDKVKDITAGKSLAANMALVKNNAMLAAQIAVEYSKLENEQ